MAQIYTKASSVLVWLGAAANDSDFAMDAIDISKRSTIRMCREEIQGFFERSYWQRLWILQEVLLGNDIWVLCGDRSFPWWKLSSSMLSSILAPKMHGAWVVDEEVLGPVIGINRIAIVLLKEKANFDGGGQKLSYMLKLFGNLQCEDARDKVYGLLSLVRDSGTISVDYSATACDVWRDTMAWIVVDDDHMDLQNHMSFGVHLLDAMGLFMFTKDFVSDFLTGLLKRNETNKHVGPSK